MSNRERTSIRRIVFLLVSLVMILAFVAPVLADTGNHTDYSDNYDYSSNSSSNDDNLFFVFYIITFLIKNFGLGGALVVVAIGFIIYRFIKKNGKLDIVRDVIEGTKSQGGRNSINEPIFDRSKEIENKIHLHDKLFSTNKFIGWSKEVFITIQEAWEDRDWAKIRPFEKEELYRLHELQLNEYIRDRKINRIDEININRAYLTDYKKDAEYEYLIVHMEVRMLDYIIDEKTEKILKGSNTIPVKNKYLLTFMRKVGVLTNPATSNMSTTRCPNCGAPIQVTSAGRCEYCDFIITTGNHDWVLNNIDSVK